MGTASGHQRPLSPVGRRPSRQGRHGDTSTGPGHPRGPSRRPRFGSGCLGARKPRTPNPANPGIKPYRNDAHRDASGQGRNFFAPGALFEMSAALPGRTGYDHASLSITRIRTERPARFEAERRGQPPHATALGAWGLWRAIAQPAKTERRPSEAGTEGGGGAPRGAAYGTGPHVSACARAPSLPKRGRLTSPSGLGGFPAVGGCQNPPFTRLPAQGRRANLLPVPPIRNPAGEASLPQS